MNKNIEFKLESFGQGKLEELIREGIQEIIKNISDENTSPKQKRILDVKIIFNPEPDRKNIKVQIETRINKAPFRTEKQNMFLGKDLAGNESLYLAQEQIPGQMRFE